MFWRKKSYSLRRVGRDEYLYREGDKSLSIYSEILYGGDFEMCFYTRELQHWNSPHESVALTEEDTKRIEARIAAELNVPVEWV